MYYGWWLLPSTHDVITLLELVSKQQAPQKVRLAFPWDYFSCAYKIMWLLMIHVLSPEIVNEVILVYLFFYMCDNDMIEAHIWAYYFLFTICMFSQKIATWALLTFYLLSSTKIIFCLFLASSVLFGDLG